MYWLILIVGLAAAGTAQPQSIESDPSWQLEPDYRKGYERPDPTGSAWRSSPAGPIPPSVQETWQGDRLEDEPAPYYRFRGDPPTPRGGDPSGSEFRFRPLSPRERERMGSEGGMRWRPTDGERGRKQGQAEPPDLFDTLTPGGPAPPPWTY